MDELLQLFISSSTVSERIETLKQLKIFVANVDCSEQEMNHCLHKLCSVFFDVAAKNPSKKIISSILQYFYSRNSECVCQILTFNLNERLKEPFNRVLFVDSLSILLDNSSPGIRVVLENRFTVLEYLLETLNKFWNEFRYSTTVIASQASVHNCQSTVKVLVTVLQKWNFVELKVDDNQIKNLLSTILSRIIIILSNDAVMWNCIGNCGMAFCLLINLVYGVEYSAQAISKLVNHCLHPEINDEEMFTCFSDFPSVSSLSILSGSLLTFSLTIKLSNTKFFSVLLLRGILHLGEKTSDAPELLLTSRSIFLWTQKAMNILQSSVEDEYRNQFCGNGDVMTLLIDYVRTYCDHYVDGVRHQCKEILKNTLQLHFLAFSEESKSSNFVKSLVHSSIKMSWNHRGKYCMIGCLVNYLGASYFLKECAHLSKEILGAIKEHALISHGSDLYVKFLSSHLSELDGRADDHWFQIWVHPITKLLQDGNNYQKASITQYVLPTLFKKKSPALEYIVRLYRSDNQEISCDLTTLLTCVRIAHGKGVLKISSNNDPTLWNNLLPYGVLRQGLHHSSDNVRLDVFSLLCENFKTASPVTHEELELIRSFTSYNLTSQSPAFRQSMVSGFMKLFGRMHESSLQLYKKVQRQVNESELQKEYSNHLTTLISYYQEFVDWLCIFLIGSIYPGANFPRHCSSLHILVTAKNIFISRSSLINLNIMFKTEYAHALLISLQDTYENNRMLSLELLECFNKNQLGFEDDENIKVLFESAIILVSSIRPQDCVTASYLLKLLIRFDNTANVVDKYVIEHDVQMLKLQTSDNVVLSILCVLLWRLSLEIKSASECLLSAASTAPMYGSLYCIRSLITKASPTSSDNCQEWKTFMDYLVQAILNVSNVVCPIVSNTSPEGHLPMDTDTDGIVLLQYAARMISDKSEDHELADTKVSIKSTAVTAQMVLLCSWRAHKEASLLFGYISSTLTISEDDNSCSGLLMPSQIILMGKYFRQQLIHTKHRGAFEQAYVGFCQLCLCLWKSSIKELHDLPTLWLESLMNDVIYGDKKTVQFCATRRSAGLPYMVQALLVTEISVGRSKCFDQTMKQLLEVCLSDTVKVEQEAKVHALNILRTLYRETKLGEHVMAFVSSGVEAAFIGFQSKSWAVRNSCTILFSALMNRMFGANRSKDSIDRKNCLTARVFFNRFPSLFEVILNLFRDLGLHTSDQLQANPVIYPILLLLGRLYPSSMDGNDSNLRLTEFVPYLQRCAYSVILKTRDLAARALVPLINTGQFVHHITSLLRSLPNCGDQLKQNYVHGLLLQLKYMFLEVLTLPSDIQTLLKQEFDKIFKDKVWIFSRCNDCFYTRAAMCEVITLCIRHNILDQSEYAINDIIEDILEEVENSNMFEPKPGRELLFTSVVSLFDSLLPSRNVELKFIVSGLSRLLRCKFYEVQLAVLHIIQRTPDVAKQTNLQSFESLVFQILPSVPECNSTTELLVESEEITRALLVLFGDSLQHDTVVVQCCAIICEYSNLIDKEWHIQCQQIVSLKEKLSFLLTKLKAKPREDVFCSVLNLAGLVVSKIDETNITDNATMIEEFVDFLLSSVESERSICYRQTTVVVMKSNIRLLVTSTELGCRTVAKIWTIVILLLQDDDSFIRDESATIVDKLFVLVNQQSSAQETSLPSQSVVALEKLVEIFNKLFSLRSGVCVTTLLKWMLSLNQADLISDVEFYEDSPFDKGEMNTYFEEIYLTQLVGKYLKNYLDGSSGIADIQLNASEIFPKKFGKDDEPIGILEFLKFIVKQTKNLVDEYNKTLENSVFNSRNIDFIGVEIYRRFLVLKHFAYIQPESNFLGCLTTLKEAKHKTLLDKEIFDSIETVKS